MAETRTVYMSFFVRGNLQPGGEWVYQFLEPDLKTPIGPIRTTRAESDVRGLIERSSTVLTEADREDLEYKFTRGRGGIYLTLTAEQYAGIGCSGTRLRRKD